MNEDDSKGRLCDGKLWFTRICVVCSISCAIVLGGCIYSTVLIQKCACRVGFRNEVLDDHVNVGYNEEEVGKTKYRICKQCCCKCIVCVNLAASRAWRHCFSAGALIKDASQTEFSFSLHTHILATMCVPKYIMSF